MTASEFMSLPLHQASAPIGKLGGFCSFGVLLTFSIAFVAIFASTQVLYMYVHPPDASAVMHQTGSVQWTWIKRAEEHYDAIAMNEYRMIHAHSVHLDLPKPKKSHANAKNEHGKFMTVQYTRTTAPKDSADKNTLMREMIAKRSQSSIAQEPSVAHCDYEERTRRWRWIRRRNNTHMVYSPFATQ